MKKISILTILAAMLTFSSCEDDPILGCTDATAINYDALATENDGSCELDVLGCTDTLATNFNALATTDDDSCLYFADLIIGSWNGVVASFSVELSPEMMSMFQMMNSEEFEEEFDTEMPTTDEEWDLFFETGFAEDESMEGTVFEFDETTLTITQDGEIDTSTYNFTTLTSFDLSENTLDVSSFEVLSCTETELVLYTEITEEEGMEVSITATFAK